MSEDLSLGKDIPSEQVGPPSSNELRTTLLAVGVIVCAGLMVYANSFDGPFIFDDIDAVLRNPYIRTLFPITEAMKAPEQSSVAGRPVVTMSLKINYAISELEVWSYHAFNLAVHLVNGLLLFGIVRRTLTSARLRDRFGGDASILAAACALLWVVHPVQTQAVTYITQRAESMMGMFYLLTLYCSIRGFTSRSAVLWYCVAIVACAAGMGAKEVMVTAPVMVFLYDWAFVSRSAGKALARRWAFYVALAATWLILAGLVAPGPRSKSAGFGLAAYTPLEYAKVQCKAIVHYIRLAFWPAPLILDYPRSKVGSLSECAGQAGVIVALLLGTVVALRYKPHLGFLGAWFFLILGPSSSFVPIADPIFEHRVYLSLAAIVTGVVLGVYALTQAARAGRRPVQAGALALAVAAAIALGLTTHRRNQDYQSEITIWQDTVDKAPGGYLAWYNLAVALSQDGRHEEAIAKCDEAIRIKSDYADAYSHRGGSYTSIGKYKEALSDLNKSIELGGSKGGAFSNRGAIHQSMGNFDLAISDFTKAIKLDRLDARYYNNRAAAYRSKGLLDQALADYGRAIDLRVDYAKAYKGRALVYLAKMNHDEALRDLDKAIELNPRYIAAYRNRGYVLGRLGREKELIANWSQAEDNVPDWPEAPRRLAWLLATSNDPERRDGPRAVALAMRACKLTKARSPVYLDVLAAALAEVGRFGDAVKTMEKACEIAAAAGDSNAEQLRARLELYKSGRPYRVMSGPDSS